MRLLRRLVLLLALSVPSVMLWADTDTVSGTDFWGGLGKSVWGSTEGWAQDKLGEGRGAARLVATAGELFSVNAEGSDWRDELDGRLENARLDLVRRGVRSGFDSVFGFVTNHLDEDRFRLKSDYRLGLADSERGWWHTDAMGLLSGLDGGAAGEGLYWQMGARNGGGYGTGEADDDQRTLLNAGLGMRRLVWDGDWLLMGHMFYDRERSIGHSRAGLGVEAKGRHLDVYGNVYHALSDRVRVGNRWEQVRGGWEVALSGRLPRVDWLELSVSHSEWDEVLGVAGESETDYGVKMQVTPLVRFEGSYEDASAADSSWSGELVFEYKFGEGISGQPSARMLKLISPEERMWEFARRDYSMKKGDVEVKVAVPEDDQLRGQSSPALQPPATPSDAFPFGSTYRDDGDFSLEFQVQTLVVHTDKLPGKLSDPLTVTLDFEDALPSGKSLSVMVRGDSDVSYRIVGASVFAAGSTPKVTIERKGELKYFSEDTSTFEEEIFWIKYFLDGDHVKNFDAHLMFLPSERTVTINEATDPPETGRFRYRDNFRSNFKRASNFSLSGPDNGVVYFKDLGGGYIGISLAHVPDYESPRDADKDNVYTVHMSRLESFWDSFPSVVPFNSLVQTIFVEVEDLNVEDFPNSRFEAQENSGAVFVAGKPHGGGPYEYALKKSEADDPDDNGHFELTTNTGSGEARFKFKAAPDYEKPRGAALTDPTEAKLAVANIYTVRVTRKAGGVESGTVPLLVTVTNALERNDVVYSGLLGDGEVFVDHSDQDVSLNVYGGTPGRRVSVTVESALNSLGFSGGGTVTSFMASDHSAAAPFVLTLRYSGTFLAADKGNVEFTLWHDDGDGNSNIDGTGVVKKPRPIDRNDISLNVKVDENDDLALAVSDYETEVVAKPDRTKALLGPDRDLFVLDEDGNLRFREAPDFESLWVDRLFTVLVRGEAADAREYDGAVVTVEVLNVKEVNWVTAWYRDPPPLFAGIKDSRLLINVYGGEAESMMTLKMEEGSGWLLKHFADDDFSHENQYRISRRTGRYYEAELINSRPLPPGETVIKIGYDDGAGSAGTLTLTATARAVPFGQGDLTATENDLTLSDFPGVPDRASYGMSLDADSPDSAYFTFEERGGAEHLVFREGAGERAGKWPDADEASDADRDGVYTVTINYWPASRGWHHDPSGGNGKSFSYTAHIRVNPDPLEGVKFLSSLEHKIDEGKLDTGYRLSASSGLGRSLSYRIESGGDGGDFELGGADEDELRFKVKPVYDDETLSNNVRTLTVAANDDDPGTVKNEVLATLTVTVESTVAFVEAAQVLSAHENVLEVGAVPAPAYGGVKLSLGGADAALFELSGRSLSFKAGTGDALGKWPDGDEHGDADGDGVYELEVHQSLGLESAKYDLEVRVEEDARENLDKKPLRDAEVEEGMTYTGFRLEERRGGLNREVSYSVRETKLAGSAFFELRNGYELHFKEAARFKSEAGGIFSNIYIVNVDAEDDDPGSVKNRVVDEFRVAVVPRFGAESLSGTAEENDLSVDVGGFSGLSPHVTLSIVGGGDEGEFELSGGALRFKAGTGDAQGKWPDADEAGDADGDGKYTLEVVQRTEYASRSTSTVTVAVSADAREGLSFTSSESVVTEDGAVDTGYRAKAVSGLDDRDVDYEVVSGGDGALFDVADDVLSFRTAQVWDPGGSNFYTVTLKAEDDDPGSVRNEAFVTVTVEVGEPLVSGTVSGTAEENDLSVTVGDLSGLSPSVRLSIVGGADAGEFELSGRTLSFRAGKNEALGKWPDADEVGGGKYTVEVEQVAGTRSATATVTVVVSADAREELSFSSGTSVVTDSGVVDTGYRVLAVSGLDDRDVDYSVAAGGDGELFDIADDVLSFRAARSWDPDGSNFYTVTVKATDDDPGVVRNEALLAVTVEVGEPLVRGTVSGTAQENDLSVKVADLSGLSSSVALSIVGGDNAGLFELTGRALSFKAGKGDQLGKWPDADEAGAGKYTVEVEQVAGPRSATATVTVGVDPDPLEGVTFLSSLEHGTDEGKLDTGYRLSARSGLGRSLSYRIESGGSGADFELGGAGRDELRFKVKPAYDVETFSSNVRTLTVAASDDDPGSVKNEATATLTVTVESTVVFVEAAQTLSAHENVLEVGDVPAPASGAVTLSLGGADAGLFELDGSRLSFKPGEDKALGKWPDGDEHGDRDGDGVYELEVHQSLGSLLSAKYDLEVRVEEDDREDLGRRFHGLVKVKEGTTDTGLRLSEGRGVLSRELSYSVRETKLAGSLFEVRDGGELHFKEAPTFKDEGADVFSNIYSALIDVEDDDPGDVKNRGFDEVSRVQVVPRFSAASLSGAAEENELAVDVGGFSGLNPHVTVSLGGGADAGQFEWSGRALSFKAGTGDALGKWPDADEAGDADGDGKYTVEVVQSSFFESSTSTVTVVVAADAREAVSFSSGTSVVTEGGAVDTGYRALAVSGLDDREVGDYDVVSGGDGVLFDVAADVLSFRVAQPWVPGGSNFYTVTLKATDDDPGAVKNEAFVTVTVTVIEPLVSGSVSGTARENELAVTVADLSGLSPSVTLSIVGGADAGLFELSGRALSFKPGEDDALGKWPDADEAWDKDRDGKYTLEVEQVDGARSATATVTVVVDADDVEDSLAFLQTSLSVTVDEGDEGAIYKAAVVGGAPGRVPSYSRLGDESGLFRLSDVGANKSELLFSGTVGAPYDEDGVNEHTVTLKARDDDPGVVKNEAFVTVTVSVEAVPGPTAVALAAGEELRRKEGESVLDILLPPGEGGLGTLTYDLVTSPDADRFKLMKGPVPAGSSVTVKVDSLDYERASVHTLTLTVVDRRGKKDVDEYVLDVLDVEERAVVTFVDGEILEIDEGDTSYVTLTSRASGGVGGDFVYKLAGKMADNDNGLFALSTEFSDGSGDPLLRFIDEPDYEDPGSLQPASSDLSLRNDYLVDVEATDDDGNTGIARVTVRVRDVEELGFEGDATVTVNHQDGTALSIVHSSRATASSGAAVTYGISSSDTSGLFTVTPTSGDVRFAGAAPRYDADGNNEYRTTVEATSGGATVSQVLVVNILKGDVSRSLGFEGGATVTVAYQDGAAASKVHRFRVTNAPDGEDVTYRISSSDTSGLFSVNKLSGKVRFAGVAPRYVADGNNEYRTTVEARVTGTTGSVSQVLVVKVLNLGFEGGASVTVNYQDGSKSPVVHRSQVTNAPDGEDVTYRISSSDTSGRFKVNRSLGSVKFAGTAPRYAADGNNEYRTTVDVRVLGVTVSQVLTVNVVKK